MSPAVLIELVDLRDGGPGLDSVLNNLLQLYEYDFSEILGGDVDASGRYSLVWPMSDYWQAPDQHAFLFRADGQWAGLALVGRYSYLNESPGDTRVIAEFFVMRKYRRQGVGEEMARRLFDRFPGRWEVGQVIENTGAQAFWRTVIGRYTGGQYTEQAVANKRWTGPVQAFDSARRG